MCRDGQAHGLSNLNAVLTSEGDLIEEEVDLALMRCAQALWQERHKRHKPLDNMALLSIQWGREKLSAPLSLRYMAINEECSDEQRDKEDKPKRHIIEVGARLSVL